MPARPPRQAARYIIAFLLALVSLVGFAQPASAHNSFVSSDPADGARLTPVPQQLLLTFASPVVLAQLQVDYTDASGVRTALTGFDFGPSGQTDVSVPVPEAASGEVSFRWKLVGADGHIVSGRVGLSIEAPSVAPAAPAAPTLPPSEAPTEPAVETTTETTTAVPTIANDSTPAPAAAKWLLRVLGFLGLVMIGGAVVTSAFLWIPAWHEVIVRRAAGWGIALIAGSAALSLAIFASEATGLGVALGTSHGVALVARLVIVPLVGLALFQWYPDDEMQRWTGISVGLVALAATWSWSGHPKSLSWPILGVPLDIAHLVAGSAWIGGLAYMGIVVMRTASDEEQTAAVHAFAPVASKSVSILVVTGALQSLRIDGSPLNLFITAHGRLLLLKIVVLCLMLYIANVNRTRVMTRFRHKQPTRGARIMLQRAMVTEAVVGIVILAMTAALVVNSPPPG